MPREMWRKLTLLLPGIHQRHTIGREDIRGWNSHCPESNTFVTRWASQSFLEQFMMGT